MSLLSSIQLAGNALNAAQIGLQVAANNIANASTPDYIREDLILSPAPTAREGNLLVGLGVSAEAVVQQVDKFLEDRLRASTSDLANSSTQQSTFSELEGLIGELGKTDLSTSLNSFFSSIHDILNQPENLSVRNLAVTKGGALTDEIQRLATRVRQSREDINSQVVGAAADINRLTKEIADLNVKIVTAEGGRTSASDAVGLRDQRLADLKELAGLVNIRVDEDTNGAVTVYSNGDYLVTQGEYREVAAVSVPDRGLNIGQIRLKTTDSPIDTSSGKLAGLVVSRDDILGGFLDKLDGFAQTLAYEFNKVYTSGQGLKGHTSLVSEFKVDSTTAALDQAGLKFTPVNGSFRVQVRNTQTGLTQSKDIVVRLNGLDDDTTLVDLAAQLNGVSGLTATITADRGLQLKTSAQNVEFAFANDTSGILAALGLGAFFTGSTASGLGVHADVKADPAKFAASSGGIGEDTRTAEILAGFYTKVLDSQNGDSLSDVYGKLTGDVIQGAAGAKAAANGFKVFHDSLQGQHLAVSGVNIDEETIKLMNYQRMYQASAKFIVTMNTLLDTLIQL